MISVHDRFIDDASQFALGHFGEGYSGFRDKAKSVYGPVMGERCSSLIPPQEIFDDVPEGINPFEQLANLLLRGEIEPITNIGSDVDKNSAVINPHDFGILFTLPDGIQLPQKYRYEKVDKPLPKQTEPPKKKKVFGRKNTELNNPISNTETEKVKIALPRERVAKTAFALGNVDALTTVKDPRLINYISNLTGLHSDPELGLRQNYSEASDGVGLHQGRAARGRFSVGLTSVDAANSWIKALNTNPSIIRDTRIAAAIAFNLYDHEETLREMNRTVDIVARKAGATTVSTVIVYDGIKASVYINPSSGAH